MGWDLKFSVVRLQILVFWVLTLCLVGSCQHFGGGTYFYPEDRGIMFLQNNVNHWQDCYSVIYYRLSINRTRLLPILQKTYLLSGTVTELRPLNVLILLLLLWFRQCDMNGVISRCSGNATNVFIFLWKWLECSNLWREPTNNLFNLTWHQLKYYF